MQASSSPSEKAMRVAHSIASRQWTWPLPALGLGAITLLASDTMWQRTAGFRSGTNKASTATIYLATMAFCTLLYWALMLPAARDIVTTTTRGGLTGLREPSDAERGCVVSLLRLMALVVVYLFSGTIAYNHLF